jgi:DNA polymerase-3 subunit delta'
MQFKDILGQESVKAELIKQARGEKLHHAHLFIGKMGFGTFGLAMAFIQYFYCENKTETDSCNECPNCHKIKNFIHLDVHYTFPTFSEKENCKVLHPRFKEIIQEKGHLFDIKDWLDFNKAKNYKIRVEETTEILNTFSMYSYEGGYKTQVIWMAEELRRESNKILKLLEEPNPMSLFVLIAESSDHILPTILSRCNIHKITRLQDAEIEGVIESEFSESSSKIKRSALHFSNGDILSARRYFEDVGAEDSIEHFTLQILRGIVKFNERHLTKIQEMLDACNELAGKSKEVQKKVLEHLLYVLNEIIQYKYKGEIMASDELTGAIKYFASVMEIDQIEYSMAEISKTIYAIERNANSKISFVSLGIILGKFQTRAEFFKWNKIEMK